MMQGMIRRGAAACALLTAAALVGCAGGQGAGAGSGMFSVGCRADSGALSGAGDVCTAFRERRSQDAPGDADVERVVVFMHGDMSRGMNDYMHRVADEYMRRFDAAGVERTVILSPLRRGYRDGKGNRSSGPVLERDEYQTEVVDQEQAFLAAQRERFPNAKVTLVGHSGGAAVAGIIAGRAPALADAFVLIGSPWNISEWRSRYRSARSRPWSQSLSPSDFVDRTRPDQQFVVVSSPKDESTPLPLSEEQHAALRQLGRQSELLVIDDATHNQLPVRTQTIARIAAVSAP